MNREGMTEEIRDLASRFGHHQASRRHIPWPQVQFPKAINAPGRHIAQIKRGGTGAAHALCFQSKTREVRKVFFAAGMIIWEARYK